MPSRLPDHFGRFVHVSTRAHHMQPRLSKVIAAAKAISLISGWSAGCMWYHYPIDSSPARCFPCSTIRRLVIPTHTRTSTSTRTRTRTDTSAGTRTGSNTAPRRPQDRTSTKGTFRPRLFVKCGTGTGNAIGPLFRPLLEEELDKEWRGNARHSPSSPPPPPSCCAVSSP